LETEREKIILIHHSLKGVDFSPKVKGPIKNSEK